MGKVGKPLRSHFGNAASSVVVGSRRCHLFVVQENARGPRSIFELLPVYGTGCQNRKTGLRLAAGLCAVVISRECERMTGALATRLTRGWFLNGWQSANTAFTDDMPSARLSERSVDGGPKCLQSGQTPRDRFITHGYWENGGVRSFPSRSQYEETITRARTSVGTASAGTR